MLTGFFIYFILLIILGLGIITFFIICKWKMFVKAGKPGWASIVPIYNTIILFEIIGYKWYYIFVFLIGGLPIVGQVALMIFCISYNIKLARCFGKTEGFGIGLCYLAVVFEAIIAFDDTIIYNGPVVNGDIDFNDLF